MSKERKKLQKKKARQKAVKKKIIEKRLDDRKQRKLERLRDEAYEREFEKKQNLGLSSEEIKERLENNMKILQALEDEFLRENPEKAATVAQVKEQLDIQQAYLKKAEDEKSQNSN
jgi:hypothetical protein